MTLKHFGISKEKQLAQIYEAVLQNYGDSADTFTHKEIIKIINDLSEDAANWESMGTDAQEEYL